MKPLKIFLILMISISLIMSAAGCGKPEQGAPASGDDEAAAGEIQPGPVSDGSKAVSGKAQDVLALLKKADTVDNYYSKGTNYRDMRTGTWEVWYNGRFIKDHDVENNLTQILDFEKNEQIRYRDLEGYKVEIDESALLMVDYYKWVSTVIFEYLKPESAEFLQKMDIGEETVNGIDCVLLDIIDFEDQQSKYYISKENGFVIKYEFYIRGGEKAGEFSRTVFETGGVTEADFALPEGLVLK